MELKLTISLVIQWGREIARAMCYGWLSYGTAAFFPCNIPQIGWPISIWQWNYFCYVMLSTLMRIGKDHMLTHFMSKPFVWKILYDCVFSSWFPSRSLFAQATYAASFKGCSVQLLLRGFKDISAKRVIVTSLFCHYSAIIPPLFVLGFEIWAHVGHVFWCSLTLEFSISLSDWPIYAYSSWGRCGNGKVYFLIIVHRV